MRRLEIGDVVRIWWVEDLELTESSKWRREDVVRGYKQS